MTLKDGEQFLSVLVVVVGACPTSRHCDTLLFNFASLTTFYKKREVGTPDQCMDGNCLVLRKRHG